MVCLCFRDRRAHPGIAKINDSHDGLSGSEDFAFAGGAHRDGPGDRRVDFRVSEPHLGLLQLGFSIRDLRSCRLNRACSGKCLMSVRDSRVEFGLCGTYLLTQSFYCCPLSLEVGFRLNLFLLRGNTRLRQRR